MKTALWFSGGKDSMACLFLNERSLKDIDVIWGNTGKNYPEVLRTIEKAKLLCPNWHEVRADRDAQNDAEGLPSDIVPVSATTIGIYLTGRPSAVKVQSYLQCCHANMIAPVWNKTKELGCEVVIRGQRVEDEMRGPLSDGGMYDGIRFEHPIEHWSTVQVFQFLRERMGELPEHYQFKHSSMDCFDCTAYLEHSADRIDFTRKNYPEMHSAFKARLDSLWQAINVDLRGVTVSINSERG